MSFQVLLVRMHIVKPTIVHRTISIVEQNKIHQKVIAHSFKEKTTQFLFLLIHISNIYNIECVESETFILPAFM